MLGVTAPPPLAQVSQLLGMEVIDAERHDAQGTARRTFYLVFADQPKTLVPVSPAFLRSPAHMSRVARRPLTRNDCRRLLRLLHEHVESTDQINPDPFRNDRRVQL